MSSEPAAPAPITVPSRDYWFRRRALPWPTWRFCLCALLTAAGLLTLAGRSVHSWLAVTAPVPGARYFVVEGWVPDRVLNAVIPITEDAGATRVFCTGIPLEHGSYLTPWKTYADVSANTLARLGMKPSMICPVPCADVKTERTRAMATALKNILDHEPVPDTGRKINLITLGTHARRSRAIFQDVLGPDWQIGVISIAATTYDAALWYQQSEGAKNVLSELSALSLMAVGGN